MRVVEVISDMNIGGAGVLLLNRLAYCNGDKYNTCVALPRGSALAPRIRALGVECVEMDVRGDASFDLRAIGKYIRLFRRHRPEVINSHGALSARLAAMLCGVPLKICTRHCFFPVPKRYGLIKWIVSPLNDLCTDAFIAVADAAKQNLISLGVDERKIFVIINGVAPLKAISAGEKDELRRTLRISADTTVLGICARLEACKGHEWFLKVLRELRGDAVRYVALLIGDGSLRRQLEKRTFELGVGDMVRFIGFVEDVSPYMNVVDININCSVGTETSSLALSEGMSLHKPAVVSDYGGNPYMVKHGENGFVCPCFDHLGMAEYIRILRNDRELYQRMSDNAYARFCNELNVERMSRHTYELYEKQYAAKMKKKRGWTKSQLRF